MKAILNHFKFNNRISSLKNYIIKHQFKNFSIIGIDIGSTNSYMAIQEPNGPRVIENSEGLRYTPSVVSINEDGTQCVSVPAKRQVFIT